ncbi:MAG TPA: hypothetical protein VEK79_10320 [Thermoanaerobaculia bacterium]|nr:hypothetical protein [Thermoanaerobaculia bacterium]
MHRTSTLVLSLLAVSILSGCAVGNQHAFNYVPTEKTEVGNGRVVLLFAVDDQRPYIVKGEEPLNFVGEQRNGYGMPFNVTTADGRPFAAVVQETVERDLEAAGFSVTAAADKPGSDIASAVSSANATRALAVVMREFKSDTFNNINFDYDFEAVVYDASGKELARDKIAGEEELKGSMMNPPKAAKQKVPAEFYRKIHSLIAGNQKIVQALTN